MENEVKSPLASMDKFQEFLEEFVDTRIEKKLNINNEILKDFFEETFSAKIRENIDDVVAKIVKEHLLAISNACIRLMSDQKGS